MERKYWVGTRNQEIGSWPPDTPDEEIFKELKAAGNPEDVKWIRAGKIRAGEWTENYQGEQLCNTNVS